MVIIYVQEIALRIIFLMKSITYGFSLNYLKICSFPRPNF